mgnify:FL=1
MQQEHITPQVAIEEAARCLLCHDSPCSKACPAGTDPGKFIRSLRFRNLKGAVETIRTNNILGSVCARVCPTSRYCEGACSRTEIDKPIRIAKLQQFLTDYEKSLDLEILKPVTLDKGKVAIVGSGPSGLQAAAELARNGYKVTIFEQKDKPGGWLTYGIPDSRLPREAVEQDISYVKKLGVEFKTNCSVGKDITLDELKKEGYKAILVAVGVQSSKLPDIDGINLEGVFKGTEFLSRIKAGENINIGDKVIVIGGGDVAMDCASVAKDLGTKDVKIVYRRTIDKMPADPEEKERVFKLDIPIFTGFKPKQIVGENGRAVRFKAEGMFDDSTLDLPADTIIFAIGQEPENLESLGLKLDNNTLPVKNYMTSQEGIFAAGDIIEGDKTVVYSVKTGKEAAKAIMEYLEKEGAYNV